MDASLKTWKLVPSATTSALWSLSTVEPVAYVRAHGPFEARQLAAERFLKFDPAPSNFSIESPPSPWLDPDLVYCFELTDERFLSLHSPTVLTQEERYAIAPPGPEPEPAYVSLNRESQPHQTPGLGDRPDWSSLFFKK